MIDINMLRENPDKFRASQAARGADESVVDRVLEADSARRSAITEYETLRAEQKSFGKQVAQAQGEDKQRLLAEVKELAERVKDADSRADAAQTTIDELLKALPNLIIDGIPAGGEDDFTVLKHVGQPRDFAAEGFEARDHLEIGELVDGLDMARGAKVGGSRFYFLKRDIARLETALLRMGQDLAMDNDFIALTTPTLVRPEIMAGTGFDVEHDDEIYRLEKDDLYLVGTSEVSIAGYHADEIIDLSDGPLRYAGWSTCYRREAGSAGKDTRGIIRVHQFNKLEMFVYCTQDQAEAEHARLLEWEEQMLQACGLSYRVIDTAAGDLGTSAARKFDCEAWIPTQGRYRELSSTSNCTTYQARRLNIRERLADTTTADGKVKKGGTQMVATLNGTLATTRWLVAILETHQQADGSVVIPEPLRPYMRGQEVIQVR
ncbi:serine--tRNA ligase [Kocuria palustris]|uniref:serine--tRNA ligase n=1 Tax=Kocuria palustris TaxID=71999 RepID=UPI0019CFE0DB|nr:serine--tRNA ligase [Kocuria palustris]MBN6753704.1 serine--tRNA ligase [Kocuria palustris]MBN6758642.1 serine--tRNA ligase [Kocuria palustris]MBN6763873.1 serine--tRNA ligase [Kocuria palustris]MBN6783215.1 serine--tRNA ligase [Kocuria palustris]MBN6799727.1 serine--tRNA ligase [Kocuria palustris]